MIFCESIKRCEKRPACASLFFFRVLVIIRILNQNKFNYTNSPASAFSCSSGVIFVQVIPRNANTIVTTGIR